jgi:UMF1 family MFS transporter
MTHAARPSWLSALLARIGLSRPELRAWALYDCANSAFWTTVIVAVFPPFFSDYAADGLDPVDATTRFAWATTIAVSAVALMAPVLGAIADLRAVKKRLLAVFMTIGVAATLLMATVDRGEWVYAAATFIAGNIAVAATLIFYDSLLPHVAAPGELDRVSTAGFAIGFLGGGVLLLVNLAWILTPSTFGLPDTVAAIRLTFVSVAVWWLAFSIPLLRRVPEPPAAPGSGDGRGHGLVRAAFVQAWRTFRELRGHRHAFLMLVAFLLYNDGIQTIIRMASIYATEVGIDRNAQIAAFVLVQFVGVPCSFMFGAAAERVGPKRALYAALAAYVVITMFGYYLRTEWQFFALAFLVGTVQGGSQALSRSLFARMVPKHKSSEYFGFFAVFEKFAGIFGPALFALSVTIVGSSRAAILSVIFFFVAGGLVLTRVDVREGEAHARLSER